MQSGDQRHARGAGVEPRIASRRQIVLAIGLASAALLVFPGAGRAATARYSPLDESTLQTSIQGDRFEIAGGDLAESKAVTPGVRALGARLVKDHSKSLREAVALAR